MNRFETEEGKKVLSYLQTSLLAEIVDTSEHVAHLKVRIYDSLAQKTIRHTEIAQKNYPQFFEPFEMILLFEFGGRFNYVVWGHWCQELVRQYGGVCAGLYWMINKDANSDYGYRCEKFPESTEVIAFLENLIENKKSLH